MGHNVSPSYHAQGKQTELEQKQVHGRNGNTNYPNMCVKIKTEQERIDTIVCKEVKENFSLSS